MLQRADVEVVLQVAADIGGIVDDIDAEAAQFIRRTDAGQHQRLRRIDRAAAEDDLARCAAWWNALPPIA
jgi:hypothetical protein